MPRTIPASAQKYVKLRAEAQMEDYVRIYRNAPSALNVGTGLIESGEGYIVYEGPARIRNIDGPSPIIIGEGDIAISTTLGSIPLDIDPVPIVDDTLLVIAHKTDPDQVGKTCRITSVMGGGYLVACRTLGLSTISDNRTWAEHE